MIRIVIQKILSIYGDDIDRGEFPSYFRFVRSKELIGADMSFKNLNGDQIMTIFTRKLFTNKILFKKMLEAFQSAENMVSFEEDIKCLLDPSKSAAVEPEAEELPVFGFKARLRFNDEEQKIVERHHGQWMLNMIRIQAERAERPSSSAASKININSRTSDDDEEESKTSFF